MDESSAIYPPDKSSGAGRSTAALPPKGAFLPWGAAAEKAPRAPAAGIPGIAPRLEYWICREVMKRRWLHNVMTFLMMPLTWKLGIRINYQPDDFYAEVPHRRINKNYYGTIGGAALLANLELAAGAYVNMRSGARHRLVCRNVSYRFMLPSTNGLHFRVEPIDEALLEQSLGTGKSFNADLKVTVYSRGKRAGQQGSRIGRGEIRFHVWPIAAAQ